MRVATKLADGSWQIQKPLNMGKFPNSFLCHYDKNNFMTDHRHFKLLRFKKGIQALYVEIAITEPSHNTTYCQLYRPPGII